MTRAADILARVVEILAALMVAGIFAVMLAQIWHRYVINRSLMWSEEAATWSLIWVVFLGSVSVMRDWGHVRVPLLVDLLPRRLRLGVMLVAKLVVIGTLLWLVWLGYDSHVNGFHRTSPMLGLSTQWVKLAIPLGAGLMAAVALVSLAEDLRAVGRAAGDDGGAG